MPLLKFSLTVFCIQFVVHALFLTHCSALFSHNSWRLIEYVNIRCEIRYYVFDKDFLCVLIVQFVCV